MLKRALFYLFLTIYGVNYAQVCRDVALVRSLTSRKFWKTEDVEIRYGDPVNYKLVKRLGAGTFGEAYYAVSANASYPCVIKIYNDNMEHSKMMRELLIMQSLCNGPNIIKLYDVVKENITGSPAIVLEYVNFTDFHYLFPTLTPMDVKYYARELLIAIDYMHRHEVLHRDIKPHNFLIDHNKRQLRLIDFGLSRFHYPGVNHSDAGTLNFQAPEVLLGHKQYDLTADMWSFGCVFAGWTFRKPYFFKSDDHKAQVKNYARTLGSEGLIKMVEDLHMHHNRSTSLYKDRPEKPWKEYITDNNRDFATPDAIEVLEKVLRWDPRRRYMADDLLKLKYFQNLTNS